jgi:hypothetical protein
MHSVVHAPLIALAHTCVALCLLVGPSSQSVSVRVDMGLRLFNVLRFGAQEGGVSLVVLPCTVTHGDARLPLRPLRLLYPVGRVRRGRARVPLRTLSGSNLLHGWWSCCRAAGGRKVAARGPAVQEACRRPRGPVAAVDAVAATTQRCRVVVVAVAACVGGPCALPLFKLLCKLCTSVSNCNIVY